jgi:hypothetical protein
MAFPRFEYAFKLYDAAEQADRLRNLADIPPGKQGYRPYRQPDYGEEWKQLRRAWSLMRSGNKKLSEKYVQKASAEFYGDDPLESIQDWIWRLAMFLCNPGYQQAWLRGIDAIEPLRESGLLQDFSLFYETVSEDRGSRYFKLMGDFFSAYSEFSQVYFLVIRGITILDHHQTTSIDFDSVLMFYGNAYEEFTCLVEYLAMLNNMLAGRKFDVFEGLTPDAYRKRDRPRRFDPFSNNEAFMAICKEADNQLRNASHHASFMFEPATQTIRYRSGKGATGPEQTITYSDYLVV